MNVKRFIGRNSREAMQKVKAAFGDDAVVLSTKPAPEGGIEVLAMAGDRERYLQAGMNDYISKPVEMKELESMILKHISKLNEQATPPT